MAGTIIVDRIESDASYASTINVAGQITFSNTVNFGAFGGTAPVTGFYSPSANALAFVTAGTEDMRITNTGQVGIGTTSPSNFGGTNFEVANTNIASVVWTNGTCVGQLLASTSSDVTVGARSNHPLRFATNDTERGRIDTSGNFQVGGTGGTNKFNVFGNAGVSDTLQIFNNPTSSAQGILFRNTFNVGASIFSTGAATTNGFINWVGGNGTQGSIAGNGAGISYGSNSDYRLKENITPMTGALSKVALLKPVTFDWKVDGSTADGFIAHELAEVYPYAVNGEKDAIDEDGNPEYQNIDTSFLVATLTAAIQELKAINDTQAATITALTARVVALES